MSEIQWSAARGRGVRAACVVLLSLMAGCGGRTVPLGVRGYMHDETDGPVRYFKINGVTGAMPDAGDGLGKVACCVNLPVEWRPGLTATVELGEGPPPWPSPRVLQVPVEEYRGDARGTLQAHFYPGGRVRIVVSRFAPGHPRYPLLEGVSLDWGVYRNYCALRPSDGVCLVLPKPKEH